jgi:eukaryotic-like serine/threonine-protein kinase
MSMGLEALLANRTEIDLELRKNKSPVTMMFTDLAGSTSFFDQFGDTAGVKWIEEHNSIVFPQVEKHKGTVVKTIGDSVMAYFPNPVAAVKAGGDILRAIHLANAKRDPKDKMYVRIALHHGLGYLRGGDVFGDVVNVAARIAKSCLPAQILVSEAVYLGANESAGIEFKPVASVQFRGKTSTEQLYEVAWTDDATYAELRKLFPPKKQDAAAATKDEDFTGGRYVIQDELGRGAMGVVYKAYDRLIGRHVALKTIPLEVEESERAPLVERLKKEANTAGALDHPNIVTVYDVGDEAGVFYFTMQYVEGTTLSTVREKKELWPIDKVYEIADQMCAAMAFAHQAGVIHRDLKPSNMMLTPKGLLKIMDFGIAKFGDSGLTKAGVILGTPSYLAPEQAAGRRIDARADVFSLGAIIYELFTTEKAFPGDSTTSIIYKVMNENPIPPRAIEPSLSPPLNDVIMKALAKDPSQRYQSAEELQEALQGTRKGGGKAMAAAAAAPAQKTQFSERTVAKTLEMPAATIPQAPVEKSKMPLIVAGAVAAVVVIGLLIAKPWEAKAPAVSAPPAASAESAPVNPSAIVTAPTQQPGANTTASNPSEPPATRPEAPSAPTPRERRAQMKQKVKEAIQVRREERAAQSAAVTQSPSGSGMFSTADIPDLLRRAAGYSGRGEYRKAILAYEEVLRIDPTNATARAGLARAKEAAGIRR